MFKKIISTILATWLLISSTGLSQVSAATNTMYDIPANYSLKSHVEKMVNEWVMTVYTDGSFKPNETVDRKQAARYIYNALAKKTNLIDKSVSWTVSPFPDVPANDFYTKYISEMKRLGIMNWYSNGTFGYSSKLTRWELLAILLKARKLANSDFVIPDYKKYPNLMTTAHRFSDVANTNTFYNVIYTALNNGYISANPTFRTNDTIVKGETAKLVNNILYSTLEGNTTNVWNNTNNNTNTNVSSQFYTWSKLTAESTLTLDKTNKKLDLTLTANTNGKLFYINKANVILENSAGNRFNVSKLTVISKWTNKFVYWIYTSEDITKETELTLMYADTNVAISASYNGESTETPTTWTETETSTTTDGSNAVSIKVANSISTWDSIPKAQNVPLMKMELTNNKEETVTISSIKFVKAWIGDREKIKDLLISDDKWVILSSTRTINSDNTFNISLYNGVKLEKGAKKVIFLKWSTLDAWNGWDSYSFKIEKAEDITWTNLTLNSTEFPLVSQSLKTVWSDVWSVLIRKGDSVSTANVWEQNVLLTSFFVDNTSGSKMTFKSIGLIQNWTFDEKYFENLKLIDVTWNNTTVSTEFTLVKDKIFFKLSDVAIANGETKSFELRWDITGEKGENIKLFVDKSTDVSIVKEYGELTFEASVDYSSYNSTNYNTVDVNGGKITLSSLVDSNTDISKSQSTANLGNFSITSNDEEIEVDTITLEMGGYKKSASATINDLTTYTTNASGWADKLISLRLVDLDTNTTISDVITPSLTNNKLSFSINNTKVWGEKKLIKIGVVWNVASTANANDEYQFKLLTTVGTNWFEATSTIDDDDVLQSNVSPTTSITLYKRTIKDAVLVVQTSSENYKDTLIKGSNQLSLVSFLLKAPSVSNVKVKTIKLKFMDPNYGWPSANVTSVANSFQNVTLYKGSEVFATAKDLVATNNWVAYVTFTDINKTIDANAELVLTIKADVTNNATANDQFYVQIENSTDVSWTDKNSLNASVTDGNGSWDNPAQTLFKNTIQEQWAIVLTPSTATPKANLIAANGNSALFDVYKADIMVTNENSTISKIKFKYGATTNLNWKENLDKWVLTINGVQVGTEQSFSTDWITFNFSEAERTGASKIAGLTLAKNQVYTIWLKVKSKSNVEAIKRGWVVSFELDNSDGTLEFFGLDSTQKLTYTLSSTTSFVWTGNAFKYYYSVPEFTNYTGTYTDVIPADEQILLVAKVKATWSYRLLLESLALKKSWQATLTDVKAYASTTGVSTSNTNLVTNTVDFLSFDKGSATKSLKLTKNSTAWEILTPWQEVTITIVWSLNNTFKGNSLSLSLEADTSAGNFVWHDNLTTNNNDVLDNKYVVWLPIAKSWVNTQDLPSDTTNPAVNTVSYQDTNVNWTIDRVTVNLTEAGTLLGTTAEWFKFKSGSELYRPTVLSISGNNVYLSEFQQYNSGNWTYVDSGAEKYLSSNTGKVFTMYYTPTGDAVRDNTWNILPQILEANAVSITDAAAPVLLKVIASTNNIFGANSTDNVKFVFSETMAAINLDNIQAWLESDVAGWSTFGDDLTAIFNDDLVANAATNLSQSTTTVTNDSVTLTADWTNTASSALIVETVSKFRVKAAQTAIKDIATSANNAVVSTAIIAE